jgi:hypothetical protein
VGLIMKDKEWFEDEGFGDKPFVGDSGSMRR